MNLYFIVNPVARGGKSIHIWKKVDDYLRKKGVSFQTYFTERKGDGTKITKSILHENEHPCVIIAVGGDGTIHEVINGSANFPHSIVGYIRAGSGNDFYRGFKIPKNPINAAKCILKKLTDYHHSFDVGHYMSGEKSGYFINNLGCGLDAAVAIAVNQSKLKAFFNKIYLGKLVYVLIFLKQLFTYKRRDLIVEIDECIYRYKNAWFVTICNQSYFGGGMKIAPQASPFDGKLNIIVVHDISRLKILLLFLTVFNGSHLKIKGVDHKIGKTINIKIDHSTPIHADGENIGFAPIKVNIMESRQKLITDHKI